MSNLAEQQKLIDNLIEEHAKEKSCRIGCNHCCYYKVVITDEEAEILSDLIIDGEVKIDIDRLKKHYLQDQDNLNKENQACIFLGDSGICNVYDNRPMMCRRFIVNTNPDFCEKGNKGMMGFMRSSKIESMLSKLDKGYMPTKIYERLKNAKYI